MNAACCACPLRHACSPGGLAGVDPPRSHLLMFGRRCLLAGEALYRKGDAFHLVHAVCSGTMKSSLTRADGRAQVCGFHLPGEFVGLDGPAEGHYQTTATALEATQTCSVAYGPLLELSSRLPLVQQDLNRLISREASRARRHILVLGRMTASERMAALLLDLSQRAAAGGHSRSDISLRMSRREIGSYLGLTTETVCRVLRDFRDTKLLEVDTRRVRFLDLPAFARAYPATVN